MHSDSGTDITAAGDSHMTDPGNIYPFLSRAKRAVLGFNPNPADQ
jgi:hypothetical protein